VKTVDNVDNSVDKKSLTRRIAILRIKKAPEGYFSTGVMHENCGWRCG
jgi:hypothetical protein